MHDFDEYASVVEEGQTLHELQQLYRVGTPQSTHMSFVYST